MNPNGQWIYVELDIIAKQCLLAKGSNKILRHFPKYMNYQLNKCIGKMIKIQLVAYDMKK